MAKDPVLVVLQLSGGNDYMNTVIPYANSLYSDNRPVVNIPEDKIVDLDDKVGFNPSMAPLKKFYDDGRWLSSTVLATRIRRVPTSALWTSGTPVSRILWGRKAGSAVPCMSSIRARKMW